MKNIENKEFKAVAFMRKRRDELSDLYNKNPDEFKKRLIAIRKKYRNKFKKTKSKPINI